MILLILVSVFTHGLIAQKTIKDWMGDIEQVDDICIIGIRI